MTTAGERAEADLALALDTLLAPIYPPGGPGAAVIATRAGKTVLRTAYGQANLELAVPMQPAMVFRLASLTKQFTALAILLLVEEGRLALESAVSTILPGCPATWRGITIQHLLTHTSGLNSFSSAAAVAAIPRRELSVSELFALLAEAPLEAAPGERFVYNNPGYSLLGVVIERLTGVAYGQYLQERIFGPLGMTGSSYDHPERVIPGRVSGYQPAPGGVENVVHVVVSLAYAAGGLLSTVDDLARWEAALATNRLLRRETLERAYTAAVLNDGSPTGYGFGWHLRSYNGHRLVEHGGEFAGFHNHMLRLPDDGVFVALLTNQLPAPVPPGQLTMRIAALLIGEPYREPDVISLPAETLERYCGTYQTAEGNTLTVRREESQLVFVSATGEQRHIYPFAPDAFLFRQSFVRLVFEASAGGAIAGLQLQDHRDGPPQRARKLPDGSPLIA